MATLNKAHLKLQTSIDNLKIKGLTIVDLNY